MASLLSASQRHLLLLHPPSSLAPPHRFPYRHRRRPRPLSSAAAADGDIPTTVSASKERGSSTSSVLTFQQAIQRLQEYWASVGCAVMQCSNTEVGAGTMNPLTFLRVLGPEPWNVAYVEPSVRPDDSRYGDNPNRLQRHTQFQVILKPDPGNSQDLFLHSLSALGINIREHDIRFVEDNWESPVLGAWGLGWEVWMDGMEITQFTYFQQAGSLPLQPVSVEITYGLERILMSLQGVDHFKNIQYTEGITYGELFLENEKEMSAYYLEHAAVNHIQKHFDDFEEEARCLISLGLPIPAYDQVLKASHAFNILDSRVLSPSSQMGSSIAALLLLLLFNLGLYIHKYVILGKGAHSAVAKATGWSAPAQGSNPGCCTCTSGVSLGVFLQKKFTLFGVLVFFMQIQNKIRILSTILCSLARQCAQLWVETRENLGHPLGTYEEANIIYPHDSGKSTTKEVPGQSRAFVLEIGTEELPPRDVVEATEQVRAIMKQMEIEVELRGPPVAKAFDQEGNPTKAAEGFCRKNNVSVDCLYRRTDGKTEYIFARVKESARFADEVLTEDIPTIISGISFPKSMRWNSNGSSIIPSLDYFTQIVFSRPIRWILALHGDSVMPFSFAGISSGNQSCGLRNSPLANFKVEAAESYLHTVENAGILIDMQERKEKVLHDSSVLANGVGGDFIAPDSLLQEVINLVEAPVPILGRYDSSFLELPKDVLITVCSVANGTIREEVVCKGNEAVLRARYEDAKFFYKMDTQKKFSEFRGQLSSILFHEKLGTMLDKMTRVENTAAELTRVLGINERMIPIIKDAAALAMSDLATSVVTEFTSLAGIMARHYALRDGIPEQVAEALFEITLPRFSGDVFPRTDAGIVLAVADRLDSLVGLFGAGCQPSSTNDPFGLRRVSYGLVQILVENKKNFDLRKALNLMAKVQPIKIEDDVIDEVKCRYYTTEKAESRPWSMKSIFLYQITLFSSFLQVDEGIDCEIVRSVLMERANCPYLAAQTSTELEAFSRTENFPKIVEAYSRPTRIIRGKELNYALEVDPNVFEKDEEKVLWNAYLEVADKIHPGTPFFVCGIKTFADASLLLIQPLEDFFNNVFVMAEDEKVRNNRLALLRKIDSLPKGIADLSVLPGF
ncbi:hypothetical protein PR202_gb18231 [Eleusine coracana subsp. coracana]|uniref:glycine--tRNA ligase n=1 Tax=Eleusine coracana subsp. coracana TaxID=191504 RepID=A0AAV5F4V5_ELECO|nr:hypothetical protein PR202_gb18231 [Eleusine coracana subsp. coracana]